MKRVISILLVCSMILMGSVTVFATDSEAEGESYDLAELFMDYEEKSLPEMVEFINENQQMYSFVQYFREMDGDRTYMIFAHYEREEALAGSEVVPNLENIGIVGKNSFKYLSSTSRVVKPTADQMSGRILLGEIGNRVMAVQLNEEFLEHINSVNRLDGNILILNFIMNMISYEDVVGVSWYSDNLSYGDDSIGDTFEPSIIGDCNGDGMVNSIDGNLMRRVVSGNGDNVDPFAVDMNGDGHLNAKDSLVLKTKIVKG